MGTPIAGKTASSRIYPHNLSTSFSILTSDDCVLIQKEVDGYQLLLGLYFWPTSD
jgi:hypothetical protein